jgi:hypothetical protein
MSLSSSSSSNKKLRNLKEKERFFLTHERKDSECKEEVGMQPEINLVVVQLFYHMVGIEVCISIDVSSRPASRRMNGGGEIQNN